MKIVAILLISLFFRLIYLGVVPSSLSHDETDNIIQAHSVIQTGHDLESTWSPMQFLPNSGVMAELSPVINVPLLRILPNNLFTDRLTTALLSSLFPLLVWYWLTLMGIEAGVAVVTAFLLAISPWHILTSRTVFEQPVSLFFYMLSWIFLTKLVKLDKHIKFKIFDTIFFILSYSFAFFTYHGYKFSLPILTCILIIWHYLGSKKSDARKLLIIPVLMIIFLLARTYIHSDRYASRSGELLFSHTSLYESGINEDLRLSLAPNFLKNIYSNKPLKLIQNLRDKYAMTMDISLLFIHGESNGVFSTWQTGYLYLLALPFLLVGLGYLLLTHKREHILLLLLLIISPIATVIHVNNSLAFRSGIYFVLLNIITAYGVIQVHKQIVKYSPKIYFSFYFILITLLCASISYFSYIYFFVTPVTNSGAYFFSDRLIANYISRRPDVKTLLIVSQPRYLYSAVKLTESSIDRADINDFGGHYSPSDLDEYNVGNLTITKNCKGVQDKTYDTIIVAKNLLGDFGDCKPLNLLLKDPKVSMSSFVSAKDSGEESRVIGDTLCGHLELNTYVHPTKLSDFKLDKMSTDEFCVKWMVRQ